MSGPETIKLHLLPDALDGNGEPRAGLLIPPAPSSPARRPVLLVFTTLAAALAEKRTREGAR